ncbi:hypothetical protein [Nitrosovibrio tenuis]|nr:hypothetical protein [Nitrosovibrio tenuis]
MRAKIAFAHVAWLGAKQSIPDNALFRAALVSLGSSGIMHGLMIETREPLRASFRLGLICP